MRQNEGVVKTNAYPNATVLALAERAADLILGRQGK
jgi:hypothetical protein